MSTATAQQATPNDRNFVVPVDEDKVPPVKLPFTQAPPVAKLDKAISELYGVGIVRLKVPAVPVPSRARVGETVGSAEQGSVDAAVRE